MLAGELVPTHLQTLLAYVHGEVEKAGDGLCSKAADRIQQQRPDEAVVCCCLLLLLFGAGRDAQ